jgi:DNA polymerase-3 subunit alpha
VGRGSGANSIVAYLLRITDVDPIELDLYFERFINLYRHNPPDFDLDFSWSDRDDVIAFIFKRFPHTALIAVYNTFKRKASVRELGKVFGLPKHEIDRLSLGVDSVYGVNNLSNLVLKYAGLIDGFPNYLGIHAGGIVISDKPLHNYSATFLPPKGLPTMMFDMVVAEDVGLYKFDILSQRGLGKIKDAVNLIHENHPKDSPLDIHDIQGFKMDVRVKYLLKSAKAIGCFYVESPAMRMLLKKLKTDTYLGLVAASSVIRPGVANSGMMREYILRFRNPERRKDGHDVLLNLMPDTYGVMVYQEDVIKVAHYFAKLTLGEADMLRRGMSGKYRSREEFLKVKEQYFRNCEESGHSQELATEIWRQIESFAGYAFAKGPSASYAVESYQCLYLKAYYPLEFLVAVLNNFGGFYSIESYVNEIRLHGGNVHTACVNKSWSLSQINGVEIYLGFILVKGLESKVVNHIVEKRVNGGDFESFEDFLDRVPISLEQLVLLVRINAFGFTERPKRELLWDAYRMVNHKLTERDYMNDLFKKGGVKSYKLPQLLSTVEEDAFDCMEYFGFPLVSPFMLLASHVARTYCLASELEERIGKEVWIEGYMVTIKKVKASGGKHMYFGNFLDREGMFLDTVHFSTVANKYPFRGKGVYAIKGIVKEEFDCLTIEASFMEKIPVIEDPRYSVKERGINSLSGTDERLKKYMARRMAPVSNDEIKNRSV